jgi:5-methyltetrahydrofolate--homocysteine methyltransferase
MAAHESAPAAAGAAAFMVVYRESPAHMGRGVVPLVQAGAGIIGACCGSTPDHVREFRRALDAYLQKKDVDT